MAKRRPVNYKMEDIQEEHVQLPPENAEKSHDILPKDPPTLPKRGSSTTNNATPSSSNSIYTTPSHKNTLETPKRNYLFTQKRLFAGDKQRNANNLNMLEPNSIEEYVLAPGLNPRTAIKDLRKHVRASTRGYEDSNSIDSGKSTRDEAGNKIKKAFDELEILRKRNAELEKLVSSQQKKSGGGTEADFEKEWKEIKDCTIEIMEHLGIVTKPLAKDVGASLSKEAPSKAVKLQEKEQAKIPAPSKIEKEETLFSLTNDVLSKDQDTVISAESEFGKDLISMMQGFKF